MANANTEVDLVVLHAAIVSDIQAAFPQLRTVEFYRADRKELPMPSCLLEMSEMEALPDDDPGTEQLCVMATFEAQLSIGFRTPNAKQAISILAANLAAWLRKRRWTNPGGETPRLPTGEAMVVGAYRDDFSAIGGQRAQDLEQYEVWRVEWQQRIHIGQSVWNEEGDTPAIVYVSQAPDIGLGNEDKYTQVYPK